MSLPSVGNKKNRELCADLKEVDALLDASERARKAVGERTMRLMAEHAASQRDFEQSLTTTAVKDRCNNKREKAEKGEILSATKSEGWEDRHRARSALLSVMDECWRSEQELAERLVTEDSKNDALADLDRTRLYYRQRLQARFAAYETLPPSVPGHRERMRKLKLDFPSPAEIVASVEKKCRNNMKIPTCSTTTTTTVRGCNVHAGEVVASAPSSAPGAPLPSTATRKSKRTKPGATVAMEMAALALNDPTFELPMQDLPGTSHNEDGKPLLLSTCVKSHAHDLDLSFPALESYRRVDQDSAEYYMPGYTAHLGEPHNRGGGFWSSLRADSRKLKTKRGRSKKSRRGRKHCNKKQKESIYSDTSAFEQLSMILTEGMTEGMCPHVAIECAEVLVSAEFCEATAACSEALEATLEKTPSERLDLEDVLAEMEDSAALVGEGLAQLLGPTIVKSNLLTPYACQRYAVACAKTFRKNRRQLSFMELVKFCAITACALEPLASSEAVALATTVADQAATKLRSVRLDVSDDLFEESSVAEFLRTLDYNDAIASRESTVLDAESAWIVVKSVAREKNLTVSVAEDPDHGALATMRMFTGKNELPSEKLKAFVTFALARSLLRTRRDECLRSIAAEKVFKRLLENPPSDAGRLENLVEEMIGDGTFEDGFAVRAICDEEVKLSPRDLDGSMDVRHFLVDIVKPSYPPTEALDLDRFLLYTSAYLCRRTPAWSELGSLLKYVAVAAQLDSHRAAGGVADLVSRAVARDDVSKDDPPPGEDAVRLVRALHSAVRSAAGDDLDFDRALGALAGRQATSIGKEEAAILLGPFATFWGATEVVDGGTANGVDPAIARRVAGLLASPNGRIDANALETFLHKTADPDDYKLAHDNHDSPRSGQRGDPTIVCARCIVFVPPKRFAVLSIHGGTKSGTAWRIRGRLFPGDKEIDPIEVDTFGEKEQVPAPLLYRRLLHEVTIRPEDGKLSHPLEKRE